jgi:hypothetical protein
MKTSFFRSVAGAIVLAWWSVPLPAQQSQTLMDLVTIQAYEARVDDYVTLHRLLEGPLPPPQVSNDLTEVWANQAALARRIRTARAEARQGDIITPDIARLFRRSIVACLPPEEWSAILAEHAEDSPAHLPPLRANAPWPDQAPFNFVPPQLLAVLPPLPPELQYRIIGRALVLWDHHANLVVDFLPGAFTS